MIQDICVTLNIEEINISEVPYVQVLIDFDAFNLTMLERYCLN